MSGRRPTRPYGTLPRLYDGGATRRRSRRRGPLSALVALLALLTGFALGAIVTTATGIGGGGAAVRTASTPSGPHPPAIRPEYSAGPSRRARDDQYRSVDSTLRYTPFVAAGTNRRRLIALTFDDGPSPYTPAIVRVLSRMHVPATFFVVGQQLNYFSAALRDELKHGFQIGDHTENHAWLIRLSAADQRGQVRTAAVRIERQGAPSPRLFRPPYGAFNAQTFAVLRQMHMLMVLWSIDPGDWRRPGTGAIVGNVLDHSRPGAIVIMHDGGGDRSQTVAALPKIITGLRRRHYQLVSVPELLRLDPPPRHQKVPRLGGA